MKKIFLSISVLALFLFVTKPALAWSPFTATNLDFNSSTNELSWDISDGSLSSFDIWDIYIEDSVGDAIYGGTGNNNQCSDFIHCTDTFHLNSEYLPAYPPYHIFINNGENSQYSQTISVPSDWLPFTNPTLTPTPTATPEVKVVASPSSGTKAVGSPFTINVTANSDDVAFNAVRATVTVSSNLTINSISSPTSNSCNIRYTTTPTISNPSFAGGIFGTSSTSCNVYTMVVTPNTTGTGTITFSNGSVKSYTDNSEILTGVTNASFTLGDRPTPTPTTALDFSVTNALETYNGSFNLTGTKLSSITNIFVNSSDSNSTYPTDTTWSVPVTLSLGNNNFTLYGSDGTNQTATQTVTVNRHTLGDINGDGTIDLVDASLFAVDWDKTSGLTYALSDMNGDGNVDLTDLSILAKLQE